MSNPSIAKIELINLIRGLNNDLHRAYRDWSEIAVNLKRLDEGFDITTEPTGPTKAYIDRLNKLITISEGALEVAT